MDQRRTIQTVLLEEVVQRRERYADVPRRFNEIEQVIASGLFMGDEELSNRSGIARQKFSVRPSRQPMLNFADDLPRRESVLSRGRGACDADEPSDLGDFQTQLTMEKKMGEHTFASVVVTHLLSKGKRRLQDRKMFGRPQPRWDSRLVEPLIERFAIPDHQYYLLDCALGFQSRKSNSDRFQTEDEIVLIPFGASCSVLDSRFRR